MKDTFREILKKPFLQNVIMLSSGTAFAQLINMLFSPLITRLYGPHAYGIMGTFTALISIIIPVAALSYPISIVLPKKDSESESLVSLSLFITMGNAIIVAVFLIFFSDEIVSLFNLQSISSFLFLIPFVIFFAGTFQTIEQWLIRKNKFRTLAKISVTEAFITNSNKVIVGSFLPLGSVLVFFTAIRRGIKILLGLLYDKTELINLKESVTNHTSSIKKIAKKYKDFPLFRAPHQFLNSITSNLPLLLLTSLFGPASAGFFSIAKTVAGVPSALIGKSVGDVFYPRISKAANNNDKLAPLVKKATSYLAVIGLIPYGIIFLFGPILFTFVFGAEWGVAGDYVRWLSIWIYTDFIRIPSVKILPVLSSQNFLFFYTIILLFVQTLSFLTGFYIFNNDIIAIALFSLAGAFLNISLIIITFIKSKTFDRT